MKQTVYTRISKSIGWENTTDVAIPNIDRAKELLREVEQEKSEQAFQEVFNIHRHAANADNNDEAFAMEIIHEAYMSGSVIFKGKYADEED